MENSTLREPNNKVVYATLKLESTLPRSWFTHACGGHSWRPLSVHSIHPCCALLIRLAMWDLEIYKVRGGSLDRATPGKIPIAMGSNDSFEVPGNSGDD
jgi:hypothetical protein